MFRAERSRASRIHCGRRPAQRCRGRIPDLAAGRRTAEVAWSSKANQDYAQFSARLAQLGDRWTLPGTNFHASPRVPWTVARPDRSMGSARRVAAEHRHGARAGAEPSTLTVTIDWGDGAAPTPGQLTWPGRPTTPRQRRLPASGQHVLPPPGRLYSTAAGSRTERFRRGGVHRPGGRLP